jgi:regulator of protease activity HflC (stomatin/prohibitin superfamily)
MHDPARAGREIGVAADAHDLPSAARASDWSAGVTDTRDRDAPPARKRSRSERRTEAGRRAAAGRREQARFEAEARRTAPSRPESSPANTVISMILGAVIVAVAYFPLKHFL